MRSDERERLMERFWYFSGPYLENLRQYDERRGTPWLRDRYRDEARTYGTALAVQIDREAEADSAWRALREHARTAFLEGSSQITRALDNALESYSLEVSDEAQRDYQQMLFQQKLDTSLALLRAWVDA